MAAVNGDGDDEAVRGLLTSLGGSGSDAAAVLDWRDADGKSRTALHVAAGRGRGAVVRMLVEAGATVNLGDSNGETALDIAVSRGEEAAAAGTIGTGFGRKAGACMLKYFAPDSTF